MLLDVPERRLLSSIEMWIGSRIKSGKRGCASRVPGAGPEPTRCLFRQRVAKTRGRAATHLRGNDKKGAGMTGRDSTMAVMGALRTWRCGLERLCRLAAFGILDRWIGSRIKSGKRGCASRVPGADPEPTRRSFRRTGSNSHECSVAHFRHSREGGNPGFTLEGGMSS